MNAATTEATDLIKNSYSTAVKGVRDYNKKIIEFTQLNTSAAFDLVRETNGLGPRAGHGGQDDPVR